MDGKRAGRRIGAPHVCDRRMMLMGALGLLVVGGLALAAKWNGTRYEPWRSTRTQDRSKSAALSYGRGFLVAVVGGFWAGILVTGPAVRLAMRLLAVTAGDDAQRRLTEAGQVIGEISLGGSIGLILFAGIGSGFVSGVLYLLVRRWLPSGRAAGPVFGLLHLVVFATRLDPLRPENPDFDLVGPGWLSVAAFGLTAVAHGVVVVAFVNRASRSFPAALSKPRSRSALAVAVPPVLALVPIAPILLLVVAGLGVTMVVAALGVTAAVCERRSVVVAGWLVLGGLTLATLPGTITGLADIVA